MCILLQQTVRFSQAKEVRSYGSPAVRPSYTSPSSAAVRLMGKRQIGELDPSELVVTILVSDLAAVPMQDLGIPMASGLMPIATLIVLEILLSCAALKSRRFRRLRTVSRRSSSAAASSISASCARCG